MISKLKAAALAALVLSSAPALAQSPCSYIVYGAVLTAGQWNQCFQLKNDALGFTPLNKAGDVLLGRLVFPAPSGSFASLNLTPGSTPGAPANGDVWVTASGIFAQVNGATYQLATGSTSVAAGVTGQVAVYTGATAIGGVTNLTLAQGGTGQTTAQAARASTGLNVDGITSVGNANYTVLATDRVVKTTATFTAPRTWTLPAASAVNGGQRLLIADFAAGVSNTNTLTIARAGADTINGGTSVVIAASNGAYYLVSDGSSKWAAEAMGSAATGVTSVTCGTGLSGGAITSTGTCAVSLSNLTNSLGSDVAMNNTANYFTGPTVAQGTLGTWFVSGTVTVLDSAATSAFQCKLWDGATVIASTQIQGQGAGIPASISLSGVLASPAGNIAISCRDPSATTGLIRFNSSGNSKDSTITAMRIQ